MTVKKTLSLKRPATASAQTEGADAGTVATVAASGGATIADRFKLDVPAEKKSSAAGAGTKAAVAAGLLALVLVGVLAYTLFGHWEFLKGA